MTEVGSDGQLIPELAESFNSDDGKRWVFDLRQGVEFHNGKTMTSEDVVTSFNHHMGEDSGSAASGLLTAVKSLTADGKNRVIFDLESANADFPFIVSDYHISIRPAGDMASGVGTGGYILESFDPGVKSVLKRNPNYWKEGKAHFDEVMIIQFLLLTVTTMRIFHRENSMQIRQHIIIKNLVTLAKSNFLHQMQLLQVL